MRIRRLGDSPDGNDHTPGKGIARSDRVNVILSQIVTPGPKARIKTLKIQQFIKDESGATAIEYGLVASLIALVILTAVSSVGVNLSGQFGNIANAAS